MIFEARAGLVGRAARMFVVGAMIVTLSACSGFNLFGPKKIVEEEVIPPEILYQKALDNMDRQYFSTALEDLKKLERQHPYSEYAEKSKLMTVYANFRTGKYPAAILAADRYLALYPSSPEVPYVLYLKGTSYYGQIKDITRDQQLAQDAIDTLQLLISTYPNSKYVDDARESMRVAYDQLAGKEMSVGRYYQGNGQYGAAINRFRIVTEKYQTSTHIEEALFRLAESYLTLGLVNEARTAAAVLGHNYPSSTWYERAYKLLQEQGLNPEVVDAKLFSQMKSG
ncbi:outer membrane protein assembly factor BamD [Mariluticola halotolerans]|uniref:outer membrane protein assembly factor BamD n=1 Tax=Mariluticola halotolerans TaxID=2909283 RepID=UPI0026E22C85|nr:outer membrane protein assembly factor BamD [Mariluticola halotolerans]UJQ94613.1 outer membrane protein assembly factor BamD [Mariluticola halotolerans]